MKAHLITAATALSLGYAANFATDGLVSATTIPSKIEGVVDLTIPVGQTGADSIRAFAATQVCDKWTSKHGLDAADCDKTAVKGISITFGDEAWGVSVRFSRDGSLTIGSPQ